MSEYTNVIQKIYLSKSGLKPTSHYKKSIGNFTPQTHQCPASQILHLVQRTDVYQNKQGDYFFPARDMGWNHPFWTKMRAISLADAASRLQYDWTKLEIPYSLESKFKESVLKDEPSYMIVRIMHDNTPTSVVLVGDTTKRSEPIGEYVEIESAIINALDFANVFASKDIQRVWISKQAGEEFTLARIAALVEMARSNKPHILCEGLPEDIDFAHRFSAYLQADNMISVQLSSQEKIMLVGKTNLINEDELLDLAKAMFSPKIDLSEWKAEPSYRGLPKIEMDTMRKYKNYKLTEYRLWAKATRIEPRSAWDIELGYPNGIETCPDLNWLA